MIACPAIDPDSNSDLGITTIFYDLFPVSGSLLPGEILTELLVILRFIKKSELAVGPEVPDAMISSQMVVRTFRNCKTGMIRNPRQVFPDLGAGLFLKRVKKK